LGITVITFRPERTGSRIDLRGNGAHWRLPTHR